MRQSGTWRFHPLQLGFFLISLPPMNSVFKALSHPVRRRIIAMLRAGPMASGDIAAAFDMAWPTVTGHLTALKDAGLVSAERDGSSIRYRLDISAVEEALAFLMDLTGARDDLNDKEG
jgi:DNA-binding transcriptional ArsR family regulator